MTQPATSGDAAAIVGAVVENAQRLGLKWRLLAGTVKSSAGPGEGVLVQLDGDDDSTDPVPAITLDGVLAAGERVMTMHVPPQGIYVIGRYGTVASNALSLGAVYPVGSIYMSTVATNPHTLFGIGTWAAIGGRFLIGTDGTYAPGSTGGAATKTLSTAEIPAHLHSLGTIFSNVVPLNQNGGVSGWNGNNSGTGSANTGNTGGGAAFSILPPYLAVYMWQRTA